MKRDFGLIREILIRVEAIPAGGILNKFDIDDFKEEEVLYHIGLLEEEELIKASISRNMLNGIVNATIFDLTWKGHDFLDNARNETIWKKTLAIVKEKGGSVSFNIFQNLLQSQASKLFEGL